MTASPECQPIVLAYLERDGHVLLSQRPPGVHQAGKWEFPGGKVEAGETFTAALGRELQEEIGVTVSIETELAVTSYSYPDRCVELHLFRCRLLAGEPTPRQVSAVRWVPVRELTQVDFPPANQALLNTLK